MGKGRENAYTYPLRVPRSLQQKLKERADKEGVSLNQYIVFLLSMAVGSDPGTEIDRHGS